MMAVEPVVKQIPQVLYFLIGPDHAHRTGINDVTDKGYPMARRQIKLRRCQA
jgi:hypothetical protein